MEESRAMNGTFCVAKNVNIKVIVNGRQVKLSKFSQISA